MEIKAINLDFYGTLVDWLPIWIEVSDLIVTENKLEVSSNDFALEWRGIQRDMLFKKEFIPYKQNIKEALVQLCQRYDIKENDYSDILFNKWGEINPCPEVPEVLNKLKEKYKLAICSNSARDLFDICANKLPIIFDKVFISDETKVNKPHLEMYAISIKNFGVPKENILHIASSQMDIKGATKAGLKVCWINRQKEKLVIDTPTPNFEIHKLTELLEIIKF